MTGEGKDTNSLKRNWELEFCKHKCGGVDYRQKLKSIRRNVIPIDWPLIPEEQHYNRLVVCESLLLLVPWIVVSVEQSWSKYEVEILRKGARFRVHLTTIPVGGA